VAYDKLKWINEPVRTSTTTPPADKPTVGVNNVGAATGEVNRLNRPMRAANENWYPDGCCRYRWPLLATAHLTTRSPAGWSPERMGRHLEVAGAIPLRPRRAISPDHIP
jgi:hypothetical protein